MTTGADEPVPNKRLVGVAGWLWFVSLYLVVLVPIGTLVEVALAISQLLPMLDRMPHTLVVLTIVDTLMMVALTLFSVYCGVAIKNVKANAIRLTKAFLVGSIGWTILSTLFFMLYFSDVLNVVDPAVVKQWSVRVAAPLMVSLLLYGYLEMSKRVQATFGSK